MFTQSYVGIVVNAYIPNIYAVKAKDQAQDQPKPEMGSIEKKSEGIIGRRRQRGGVEGSG